MFLWTFLPPSFIISSLALKFSINSVKASWHHRFEVAPRFWRIQMESQGLGHGFQRSLWQHDDGAGPMASISCLRGVFGDTWIILSKSIIALKSHQGSASLFSLERHASALTYQISTAVLTAWWRRGSNCIHFVSSGSLRGYMDHFEQVYHRFEVAPRFCIPLLPRKACICPYLSDFNGRFDSMMTARIQLHPFCVFGESSGIHGSFWASLSSLWSRTEVLHPSSPSKGVHLPLLIRFQWPLWQNDDGEGPIASIFPTKFVFKYFPVYLLIHFWLADSFYNEIMRTNQWIKQRSIITVC